MKTEKTEQFLNFCCEMGRALIQNGAEIYRVEDSINRLLLAYGYLDTEVFAIPSCVILNIQHEGHNYTKSIRIRTSFINLDKLDRLNSLCRRVCRERPPAVAAFEQLRGSRLPPVTRRGAAIWRTALWPFFSRFSGAEMRWTPFSHFPAAWR